jgi:hypothetical protein
MAQDSFGSQTFRIWFYDVVQTTPAWLSTGKAAEGAG